MESILLKLPLQPFMSRLANKISSRPPNKVQKFITYFFGFCFTLFVVVYFQGIFGHVFFKEVFSFHWYIGICFMLVGFYIIHKNHDDIDKKESDGFDLNDKEKKE